MENKKWITVKINGTQKRFPESQIPKVMEHMDKLAQEYLSKGAPIEMVEKVCSVEIVKEEE